MKLNKSIFLTALLAMGLSVGFVSCGDDDKDDEGNKECKASCDGNTLKYCEGGVEKTKECGEAGCDADKGVCKAVTCTKENASEVCKGDEACVNSACSLCGNGKIDEGEVCDIGLDGVKGGKDGNFDDIVKEGATCQDYGESNSSDKGKTWVSGKPSCGNTCETLAKGSCKSSDESEIDEGKGVNGITECGSNLAFDANGAGTASVTYKTGSATQDQGVKAAIVCGTATANIGTDVPSADKKDAANGAASLTYDLSSSPAGSYTCYVIVDAGEGAVVCPLASGKPVKATGSVTELVNSTVVYTKAGESGTMAEWNNFNIDSMNTVIVADGIAPTSPDGAKAKLKLVVDTADNYNIKIGQNGSGANAALQIGNKKPSAGFPKEKPAFDGTSSRLVISNDDFSGKTIEISAKTGKYGGKFSVVAGTSEIVEGFNSAEAYGSTSGTIPASTNEIVIYPWFDACTESTCGNINIERITIK